MIRRWSRSRPVNKNAQHAVLARPAYLRLDYFQPARARHALGNLPDLLQIKSHVFSNLRPNRRASHSSKSPVNRPANRPKLKSGLSPTGVLRQSWHYDTTVFIANYTPPLWKTQTAWAILPAVLGRPAITPGRFGGFRETHDSRGCSYRGGSALRSPASRCSECFYTRPGQIWTCAALPAAWRAVGCLGRRPDGFHRRLHDSSQDARRLQGRSAHSSQPGERNRPL